MTKVYCLDTYALIEIENGNPAMNGILKEKCIIPELILAEFYKVILRRHNKKTADYWVAQLEQYTESTSMTVLCKAVDYFIKRRSDNISQFDAIGYIHAQENNQIFVTGDKEFAKEKGVLFIKEKKKV